MNEEKEKLTENQVHIKYLELSDELGFTSNTIHWVHACVVELSSRKQSEVKHVNAKDLCIALVRDIISTSDNSPENVLSKLNIKSSEDIGLIVEGLLEKGLLRKSDDDSIEDFNDLFKTSELEVFLQKNSIQRKRIFKYFAFRKFVWCLWTIGAVLVIGSWVDLVPHKIAMYGFYMSVAGFLLSFIKTPETKRF